MVTDSALRAERILAAVRAVPEGFVRTYGDVSPGAPRLAGAVLSACEDATVPWHRIVRSDGSLAQGRHQRRRLEREGVPFRGERVQMRVARLPEDLWIARLPEALWVAHRLEDLGVARLPEDLWVAHRLEDLGVAHRPEDL